MIVVIKRFIKDLKKYNNYAFESAKAELKSEVSSSYLGALWWILDPLLFMLIYTFVSVIVFGKSEPYFSAFIFIGYTSFKFFERCIKQSVKLIASNKSIIRNVYLPKSILLVIRVYVNFFQCLISYTLVFCAMLLYRVPLTWHVIQFFPMVFLLVVVTFGFSCIFTHYGVFLEDLSNILTVVLKLIFYLSGIFYSISKRLSEYKVAKVLLLKCNPVAFVIDQMRESLLYGEYLDYKISLMWILIGFIISAIGLYLIYKNENGYVKVV